MTAETRRNSATLFLRFSRVKLLKEYWPRLRRCLESLTDEQVWWRPNGASNSVGNLLLHLDGNVHQWLVASFSGLEDLRNRPGEFKEQEMIPAAALLAKLGATMNEASGVLSRLTETELLAEFEIQGYTVRGLDAVYQVVEHFGMHYGQIVYITKMLRASDLGFYRELNETGRRPSTPCEDVGLGAEVEMRFAKIVFLIAGILGLVVVTPLFFLFDYIGELYPPAINHPDIYYGFVTVTLAWQVAFLVISRDPVRFRPLMLAAMMEKFPYVIALAILHSQGRIQFGQAAAGIPDFVLGLLFVAAFVKTR